MSCLRFAFVVTAATALASLASQPANAQMVVHFGTVEQFRGPDDLDLTGDIVYAVSQNHEQDRVVNGVNFLTDINPIPGYSHTMPQIVSTWQTKPEFGDSVDDDNLEEIMNDIRWTERSGVGWDMVVEPGHDFKLQLLWSGNHEENRRWQIDVNGQRVVTEAQSLGELPYDIGASIVYTGTFTQSFVRDRFQVRYSLGPAGTDPNGILSAIILEDLGQQVVAGDANGDDEVNLEDFDLIRANLFTGTTLAQGDVDIDGDVDLDDFGFWKSEFGGGGGAVPEPGSLAMLATGGIILGGLGWRRARRRNAA